MAQCSFSIIIKLH